jgi:glycerol-3-phosphate dehydrogenase subunit B
MSGNEFDLLVIGEGFAGINAAAAACRQGMRVMLASTGPGSFVLGTACLDLDGITAAELSTLQYSPAMMEEAIAFFRDLSARAGCAYDGGTREHRLVPTVMGTFQSVSMAPRSIWKGDPTGVAKAVVVGVDHLSVFDPDFVAERLFLYTQKMGLNASYRSVTVQLPDEDTHPLTTVEIATRWDRNPAYRGAFVDALKRVVKDAELLILPGVLGVKSDDDEFFQLEEEIGCAICELPTVPPSVPGLRLLQRFENHLARIGVEMCTGFSVQNLCLDGDRCTGAYLDVPGKPRRIQADCVVLASGRFSRLLEAPESKLDSSLGGLHVNQEFRPVNRDGSILATNLFECGSVLGSSEPRHRNAIAILTGYHAGMLASRTGVTYATR